MGEGGRGARREVTRRGCRMRANEKVFITEKKTREIFMERP